MISTRMYSQLCLLSSAAYAINLFHFEHPSVHPLAWVFTRLRARSQPTTTFRADVTEASRRRPESAGAGALELGYWATVASKQAEWSRKCSDIDGDKSDVEHKMLYRQTQETTILSKQRVRVQVVQLEQSRSRVH
jgi:hypothetical protein